MTDRNDQAKTLVLPPGITEEQLVRAVVGSGYPLQTVVALQLNTDFTVVEEWGYVDRISNEHRALDLFADRGLMPRTVRLEPHLTLLIECKRSELPYVFFAAAVPRVPPEFPTIVGFRSSRFELHRAGGYREVSPAEFLRSSELPFCNYPTVVSALRRVERKGQKLEFSGSVPFNSVVLPLAAALDHYKNTWSGIGEQKVYYPSITLCISVVDAPMIVARGTPEEPKLTNEPWVRVVRQEAVKDGKWWRGQHYVIDIVQRVFFASYIADHAVPAAEQLASRMKEREDVVVAAKGTVADNEWSWPNAHPVSSRARGG